jgi:hypothetical protein
VIVLFHIYRSCILIVVKPLQGILQFKGVDENPVPFLLQYPLKTIGKVMYRMTDNNVDGH